MEGSTHGPSNKEDDIEMALRVGIIGAGGMGHGHARAYQALGQELVGVADPPSPANAERFAAALGGKVFASVEELLADPTIDLVSVTVPTPAHREVVCKAAAAGKHIVCEKPLARTLEDADAMIAACRDAGVRLFAGHVVRYFPEYEHVKSAIDRGDLGQIGVVRTTRGGSEPTGFQSWYRDLDRSGGLLVDLAIHDIDWLRWCFGEVERVYATSSKTRVPESPEYALAILRFESGVIAHVEGSWAHPGPFRYAYEVAGSKGVAEFDNLRSAGIVAQTHEHPGVVQSEYPYVEQPLLSELQDFVRAIQSGEQARVTAEDARAALRISLACLESARTGQPVWLKKEGAAQ